MRNILLTCTLASALFALPMAAASTDTVRSAQQALKDKGFDPGPIDGIDGPKTRAATRAYQKQQSLTADGALSGKTLDSLGVKPGGAEGEFDASGHQLKKSYKGGGKDIAEGSKDLGKEVAHGDPVDAGKDFGKGIGKGAKKIGVGTAHAAVDAAKGVKKAAQDH